MNSSPTPLFVFSLPRSGSTLLQRILASHEDIETVAEPHFLLPMIYSSRRTGVYADYQHEFVAEAVENLWEHLPGGEAAYWGHVRNLAATIYGELCEGSPAYFLDKTPRYHLIAADLIRIFPDAKFIFLWRNPLSVIASWMETFDEGRWNAYRYKVDMFQGLTSLVEACVPARGRICEVRYEDLIASPEVEVRRLMEYLSLPFHPHMVTSFSKVKLEGRLKDPTLDNYSTVSSEPVAKWKKTLNNPLRMLWCLRYLQWIGEERLATMGYDYKQLAAELRGVSLTRRGMGSDARRMLNGILYSALDMPIIRDKIEAWPDWTKITAHT